MTTIKPNLFLIGVPKAGTSAIANGLKQHPEIFAPEVKEPRFFDARTFYDRFEDHTIKDISQYLRHYNDMNALTCKYRLDASVLNVYDTESIKDILLFSPDAKFILILRDPLSATKSMFLQRMKYITPQMREISENFVKCWKALPERRVGRGFPNGCRNKILFRYDILYSYQNFLPQVLNLISDKIFIGYYEDFKQDPSKMYRGIFEFLKVDAKIKPVNTIVNPSYMVKPNAFHTVCHAAAAKTFKIRRMLGLSGKGLFKKIITPQFDSTPQISTEIDHEIKEFFKETYIYMKFLRKPLKND